ncbi:glycosyltransferases involved in cell wall biogenesis [Gottschalkia purinilytica]|uniref:Glycosyltransferases involved in cell wall biogenesis n=1 Tax=Gottschalkia purinilytica TaxID=1503 RepID=A0A0L0WDY9_GOTPU|nr:glycosyltransferase [Gottschalkia purinilytica]KNF09651.1 glycosyltransferases involved in cell wall biogenesis [Gottschalkia purinilytica]
MRLSLCMIVKDEEENIVECLDRALKVVDEAIIVDTGSIDKTRKLLLEKYSEDDRVKIIDYEWENDFSKARNKSLQYAMGDWILVLDADERIFCNRNSLEKLLLENKEVVYSIPIYNIYGKDNFTVSTSMIRLYKNDNPIYKGAIHEQIFINGKQYLGGTIDKDICKIYHYGYDNGIFEAKNKSKRNMDIIKSEIEKDPKDPFNWYNKAIMEMIDGNFNSALNDFIKAHNLCNGIRKAYHNDLLIRMIQCMMMLKRYKDTISFIKTLLKDECINKMPDIYYYLGMCYKERKKYKKAIENFKKAIEIGDYYEGISKYGTGSFLSLIEWGEVLKINGRLDKAIEKYKEAIFNKNNPTMKGLEELKILLEENNMTCELKELEEEIEEIKETGTKTNNTEVKIELEKYKEEFKNNIQVLLEQGLIKEAKEMVLEFEKIVKNDVSVFSIKGIMSMMEGSLEEAERNFLKGLEIESFNVDILYNLAYLYESQGKITSAYRYYIKIQKSSSDEILLDEVKEKIKEYEKLNKIKDYKNRKKVLFISHIFPPLGGSGVQRSLKFVKYLRDFGWEPIVVTTGKTKFLLRDEEMISEIPEEVEIIRIDEVDKIDGRYSKKLIKLYSNIVNDNDLIKEYVHFISSSQEAYDNLILFPDQYIVWAKEVLEKIHDKVDFNGIDMIYTTSGPNSAHTIGYYLKERYSVPWIADFRDEWTNNPMMNYDKESIIYKMSFAFEQSIIHYADKVVTCTEISSDNYKRIFNLDNKKVDTITNGYDEDDFNNIKIQNYRDKFRIIHNGLLYGVDRKVDNFIKAIYNLIINGSIDKSKIEVTFGPTDDTERYKNILKDMKLEENIMFIDYLSHEESLKLASKSNLLLLVVGKSEKWKGVPTGKIYEYLRLCKPILALSPKESIVEEIIEKQNRGKNIEFDDIKEIERYILQQYNDWLNGKENSLEITDEVKIYERKLLSENLSKVFDEIHNIKNRRKLAFFCVKNGDSFLDDIITNLSREYEIKKIIIEKYEEFNLIDKWMQWSDICWFEWCDSLAEYGSKISIAKEKFIICRLHSYEAFTNNPNNVNWDNIDKIVFVAEHIRRFVIDKFDIREERTCVIPNGIDMKNWTFKSRNDGFNIANVGYIDYKKGPMLLLQAFKSIYDMDCRYKLYLAGKFKDDRDVLYFNQMVKQLGIEKNVFFEGWQNDLDNWLEDKNYILCTSVLESQNMSVMQAMSKGIKPIIHNFVGAKGIYKEEYIWNTIDEASNYIVSNNYDSKDYRDFIKNNYELSKTIKSIRNIINCTEDSVKEERDVEPLVTIGVTTYNCEKYLTVCLDSILKQTYKNIEILIVDDCSTDNTINIINRYKENHKNVISIYHDKNSGGASKGINEIIRNSNGKYFQWIACDDSLQPQAIETFVKFMENNDSIDYVYSNFNIIDKYSKIKEKCRYNELTSNEIIKHIFNTCSTPIPLNCLYRKSFFVDNEVNWIIYKGNDFSCDTINILNFIKNGIKIRKLEDYLVNYRIHDKNLSYNIEKRIYGSTTIIDYIVENFDEDIYLPNIEWSSIKNRKVYKSYIISRVFEEYIKNHLNGDLIPKYINNNKKDIERYMNYFAKRGIYYLEKFISYTNGNDSESERLKEYFSKYCLN